MTHCTSPFCIIQNGVRGRDFEPTLEGIGRNWCPQCVDLTIKTQFFSAQTANMIRAIYQTYIETDLPKEVKMILEQFTRELMTNLDSEL
jgi:hypothetical protein